MSKKKRQTEKLGQVSLHNNPIIRAKDASLKQLEDSIQWYESTLKRYPLFMNGTQIDAPAQWHENLRQLKAERAARVGKTS